MVIFVRSVFQSRYQYFFIDHITYCLFIFTHQNSYIICETHTKVYAFLNPKYFIRGRLKPF